MAKLLHIDASPRSDDRSKSKRLSRLFVEHYTQKNNGTDVTHRDVGKNPPPPVSEPWVAAAFGGEQNDAIETSNELVDELLASDVIAIGTPMYNFGMPAQLKAWFDQVVRIGRTFNFDPSKDNPYEGLATGKKAYVCVVYGGAGFGDGQPMADYNFLDGHLRTLLGFIGITDVEFVRVEKANSGDEVFDGEFEQAKSRVQELV